jgi:hypothetical protein
VGGHLAGHGVICGGFPSREYILSIITSLRNDGTAASLCLGTAKCTLSGEQCLLYVVRFPDGAMWAVRIAVHTSHLQPEPVASYVKTEVSTRKRLEMSWFSWSLRLLGYDSGFDNHIGYPYSVLRWIEGTPLEWSDMSPRNREKGNKILHQMADIILEVAHCTKESSTPVAPFILDYLMR